MPGSALTTTASSQRLHLNRKHCGQISNNRVPTIPRISGSIDLTAGGSEIDATLIESVDRHRIPQNVHIAVALGQTLCQRFPLISATPASIHPQLAIRHVVLGIALDGNDINRLWFVRVNVNDKPKICWKIAADLAPILPCIVTTHHVPVLLHKEYSRPGLVHRNVMDAMPNLGRRIR